MDIISREARKQTKENKREETRLRKDIERAKFLKSGRHHPKVKTAYNKLIYLLIIQLHRETYDYGRDLDL